MLTISLFVFTEERFDYAKKLKQAMADLYKVSHCGIVAVMCSLTAYTDSVLVFVLTWCW